MLYSCITDIDQITKLITLESEACLKMKEVIEENPTGYFEDFVRLGMWSSNSEFNSVTCEPFWKQIFGSEKNIASFIKAHQSRISKARLINNFWKLYENNNYKPIEFEHQGNVQKKINANLAVSDYNSTYGNYNLYLFGSAWNLSIYSRYWMFVSSYDLTEYPSHRNTGFRIVFDRDFHPY